ncbi:MAG: PhoH family protein, partial [Treponema sp.]|nr:PhoH family protein [Treponema sp.]
MEDSITIVLDDRDIMSGVCGVNDGNLRLIEGSLGGRIAARGNEIRLEGADETGRRRFKTMMNNLIAVVREGECPTLEYVRSLAGGAEGSDDAEDGQSQAIRIPHGFGRVYPRSRNQAA